ncbi:Mor transcription activator family protein [Romboutsia sedimentorum]|uniref:Mor transcription activator family protein n=1 Tax=Romboutsia sedimentorum TaxID=1368474 RepID=A0ABT7E7N9_9FIRM|nr:Mor transcription activator family protein [Romboutsia sedimentorum]MDK2562952.1 Mor transcription activator family protein [Romboutsia sedimentorum]
MYEDVILEDFSEELVGFVDFIGIDKFIDICDKFGGDSIYFPKKSSVLRCSRNRKIRAMYDGYNIKNIAKEFGITREQVKNIIKE